MHGGLNRLREALDRLRMVLNRLQGGLNQWRGVLKPVHERPAVCPAAEAAPQTCR